MECMFDNSSQPFMLGMFNLLRLISIFKGDSTGEADPTIGTKRTKAEFDEFVDEKFAKVVTDGIYKPFNDMHGGGLKYAIVAPGGGFDKAHKLSLDNPLVTKQFLMVVEDTSNPFCVIKLISFYRERCKPDQSRFFCHVNNGHKKGSVYYFKPRSPVGQDSLRKWVKEFVEVADFKDWEKYTPHDNQHRCCTILASDLAVPEKVRMNHLRHKSAKSSHPYIHQNSKSQATVQGVLSASLHEPKKEVIELEGKKYLPTPVCNNKNPTPAPSKVTVRVDTIAEDKENTPNPLAPRPRESLGLAKPSPSKESLKQQIEKRKKDTKDLRKTNKKQRAKIKDYKYRNKYPGTKGGEGYDSSKEAAIAIAKKEVEDSYKLTQLEWRNEKARMEADNNNKISLLHTKLENEKRLKQIELNAKQNELDQVHQQMERSWAQRAHDSVYHQQFLPTRGHLGSPKSLSNHIDIYRAAQDSSQREDHQRTHDVYQAIYTLFTEADGDRLLPLLLDIFNAQAIGGLGIFQEDAAGVDRLRVIHGLRRYPGTITQPSANRGRAFGYIDDVEGQEGELVQVDAALLSRASASRVYLMAHHEAAISQHPDRDYIPAIPEGTAHTEMLQAHKVCFLPFEFVPLVLCRGLTPKQAFQVLQPHIYQQGLEGICKPLLDTLRAVGTQPTTLLGAIRLLEPGPAFRAEANLRAYMKKNVLIRDLPGLTGSAPADPTLTAAFSALTDQQLRLSESLDHRRQKSSKLHSVREVWGTLYTERLLLLCGKSTEADLPPVYTAWAKKSKHEKTHMILQSQVATNAYNLGLQAPLVTTAVLKRFQDCNFYGTDPFG
eukprot:jgi/Psemu1/59280/gm1.59280_g